MARAYRMQRQCEANPQCGTKIGVSGSVTHPLISILASASNWIMGEPLAPTGLSTGIHQNSASTRGSAQAGVDYASGIGTKIVGSIDVLDIAANPDTELTLVAGLGVRLYWENSQFVGFGFAAGVGASLMTRPVPLNVEVGTTPATWGFQWGN